VFFNYLFLICESDKLTGLAYCLLQVCLAFEIAHRLAGFLSSMRHVPSWNISTILFLFFSLNKWTGHKLQSTHDFFISLKQGVLHNLIWWHWLSSDNKTYWFSIIYYYNLIGIII